VNWDKNKKIKEGILKQKLEVITMKTEM